MAKPRKNAAIDWEYSGPPNPIMGTGATLLEQLFVWLVGLAAAGLYFYLGQSGWFSWEWWHVLIAAFIAFDLIGGAVANHLNSAKRFHHAPRQAEERGLIGLFKSAWYYSAVHVHPLVIYLLWKPKEFFVGLGIYVVIIAATIVTRLLPVYLARPFAATMLLAAILASTFAIRPVPGFEWLLPVLVLKVVMGFGVREEPYRP